MIDCNGTGRTWGCYCERCDKRDHPMDRVARFTPEQKAYFAKLSDSVDRRITKACISCGSMETRFYAGGYFCEEHKP